MSTPYFFFQPLLDPNQAWKGLNMHAYPAASAHAEDYQRCVAESGVDKLLRSLQVVLASDPAWFDQPDFMQKFDRDKTIFVVPAPAAADPDTLARCKAMRAAGSHLALSIDSNEALVRAEQSSFDHLLFDAGYAQARVPMLNLINATQAGQTLIATGVHSHDLMRWAVSRQFQVFSSEYVLTRDPAQGQEADTTRMKLLRLLSLTVQDADTAEIEKIFREEPKLSYNLLRLVNSVAVGAKSKISSFSQAITVLGRRQLQRWLQLLIYANQYAQGSQANPLMNLAAARGRQLELLVAALPQAPSTAMADAAFMTGIFSLLDVLLGLSMSEVLTSLPLSDEVASTLQQHEGILGQLLDVIIASDQGEFAVAAETLERLGISADSHAAAQVSALHWAGNIALD